MQSFSLENVGVIKLSINLVARPAKWQCQQCSYIGPALALHFWEFCYQSWNVDWWSPMASYHLQCASVYVHIVMCGFLPPPVHMQVCEFVHWRWLPAMGMSIGGGRRSTHSWWQGPPGLPEKSVPILRPSDIAWRPRWLQKKGMIFTLTAWGALPMASPMCMHRCRWYPGYR